MGTRPIAVADLGSNTLHLLIAVVEDGRVRELVDEFEMVRLSDDVDRTGAISDAKLARTIDAVRRFQHRAACTGADRLHLMATQAVRHATNRAALLDRVAGATGLPVTLLTPEDEARLAFDGVVLSSRHAANPEPFLLVDVGGSATHLILGRGSDMVARRSLPLGSGKLTTLHVVADPPTADEMANIKAAAEEALLGLDPGFLGGLRPTRALGAGGSAKALRRLANLARSGQPIAVERLRQMLETLQRQNASSIGHAFEFDRQRARVLPAGILVLERVLTFFDLPEITPKQSGIRDGAVLRITRTGGLGANADHSVPTTDNAPTPRAITAST